VTGYASDIKREKICRKDNWSQVLNADSALEADDKRSLLDV
jgi:hypothetical protein